MKIKIKKGTHYPFFIPIPIPIWVKKRKCTFKTSKFKFTESCLFDLKDEDQHDVNKLFGFSIGYHHKNSFRFGWRPILSERKIEIVAYEYHNGVRQTTKPICRVNINSWHEYVIIYDPIKGRVNYFVVHDGGCGVEKLKDCYFYREVHDVKLKNRFGLGYMLGIYFGGNEVAPQDIVIYKKNS